MNPSNPSAARLPLLDGLRGLAALMVVMLHLGAVRGVPIKPFDHGYLAVDLFFLLSGFVLTLAFERKFAAGLDAWAFFKLRLQRLWPTMLIGNLIGLVAYVLMQGNLADWLMWIITILLVPMWQAGRDIYPFNPVQWSLAFELIANFAHAALLRRMGNRGLLGLIVLMGVILGWGIATHGSANIGGKSEEVFYGLARVGFSYPLGIFFARRWTAPGPKILIGNSQKSEFRDGTSPLPRPTTQGIVNYGWSGGGEGWCRTIRNDSFGSNTKASRVWWLALLAPIAVMLITSLFSEADRALADGLVVIVLFPLLFLWAIRLRVPEQAVVWLSRLGALSFPIYAVHYQVFLVYTALQLRHMPLQPLWQANLCALILALAVAVVMSQRLPLPQIGVKRTGCNRP